VNNLPRVVTPRGSDLRPLDRKFDALPLRHQFLFTTPCTLLFVWRGLKHATCVRGLFATTQAQSQCNRSVSLPTTSKVSSQIYEKLTDHSDSGWGGGVRSPGLRWPATPLQAGQRGIRGASERIGQRRRWPFTGRMINEHRD